MAGMLIALALFGCSDDATACERIVAPTQTYQSQARCEADAAAALESEPARRADYPSVVAQCISATALAKAGARTIDLTQRPFRLPRPMT